ncbi:MAG: ATP synthase F1 subunit gamma, partial [Pseudomonadota bacterium]|nr:ATP synthase F1 subunit gamma [Pseudomonadota bacterium]
MASLKELRNRISSVKATQKITRAMQMVAASKLRRAQEIAEAARPYAERMSLVLSNLSAGVAGQDCAPALLSGTGKEDTHLLVVATAERGLCGGFNASIAKLAKERALALKAEGKTVKILCIGRKGGDLLKRDFEDDMLETVTYQGFKSVGFEQAQEVAKQILELFETEAFDVCSLYYSEFVNVITQNPKELLIIPAHLDEDTTLDLGGASYDYEPEENEILDALL